MLEASEKVSRSYRTKYDPLAPIGNVFLLAYTIVTQRGSSLLPRNPLGIWTEDSSLF